MKKLLLVLALFLSGCASVNFSSKYYTPPPTYKADIDEVWNTAMKLPLKYKNYYSYKISQDSETKSAGVPQIYNNIVYLPEYFIKYVYEFYYPKYHKQILACIILHELAHPEGGINDKPPDVHFDCDKYAIDNFLPHTTCSIDDFYSSLIVMKNYWSARKGAGGHLFNASYNLAVAWYGGIFVDMYATDIKARLSYLRYFYPKAKFIYQRTK